MEANEKIKLLRSELGLTLEDVGKAVGVGKSTVRKWETGDIANMRRDKIVKLARVLHTTPAYLLGYGDEPFEFSNNEAPSLSDEAMKIAKDYSDLDSWGKSAVREVLNIEKQRCEDEDRFINDTQFNNFEPKVINLYLEPSAAGIAAPVEGKDFEPYELGPDDPQGAAYAIRVQGDSMEPDFPDGSTVFVNHDAIVNGDIGVFCVDGGTVIKQYYRDPFGMTYLFSLNRKRADADVPIYPSSGQTLVCQGRVITRHRYPIPPLAR